MLTKTEHLKILETQLKTGALATLTRVCSHLDAVYALLKCSDSEIPFAHEELQAQSVTLQRDFAILTEYLEMLRTVREMQNSQPQLQLRIVSLCPPLIS